MATKSISILVVLFVSTFTNAQNLTDNLLHFYTLDNDTIVDAIGGTVADTSSSEVVVDGIANGSHAFNDNDYVRLLDFAPSSFTINLWFKTNDSLKIQRIFHRGGVGGSPGDKFSYSLVYIPSSGFRFSTGEAASGGNAGLIYATNVNVSDWHMITCSYDNNSLNLKMHIDGNLVQSTTASDTMPLEVLNKELLLSLYPHTTPQTINGNLDEIGLWNRILTDAEVMLLFQAPGALNVEKINHDFQIAHQIYPNPANNTIQVSNILDSKGFVIYNSLNQEVKKGTITKNQSIDITTLTAGVYFLNIENETRLKFTKE